MAIWSFAVLCGKLAIVVGICYTFPILVHCIEKNLATLVGTHGVESA
jgi:hypothetical protein